MGIVGSSVALLRLCYSNDTGGGSGGADSTCSRWGADDNWNKNPGQLGGRQTVPFLCIIVLYRNLIRFPISGKHIFLQVVLTTLGHIKPRIQ
jgi:hypothetical protein